MSCPPANSLPDRVTAGETLAWLVTLPAYPASAGNTLKYALQSGGASPSVITLTATASGDSYQVAAAASITAAWAAGIYTATGYVEYTVDAILQRVTVSRSLLTVLPSPLAALGATHAARMLALIEAALERRVPAGLEHTSIDGQELSRIPLEALLRLRDKYRRELASLTPRRRRPPLGIQFTHSR